MGPGVVTIIFRYVPSRRAAQQDEVRRSCVQVAPGVLSVVPHSSDLAEWPMRTDSLDGVFEVNGPLLRRSDERFFDAAVREHVTLQDPVSFALADRASDERTDADGADFMRDLRSRQSDPVTRSLSWQLGVPTMRYSIDGVLAALTSFWSVETAPVSSTDAWLDDELMAEICEINAVDAMLFACAREISLFAGESRRSRPSSE